MKHTEHQYIEAGYKFERGRIAAETLRHITPLLLNRDPQQIEDIWHVLYRQGYWRGGPMPVWCEEAVEKRIRKAFDYAFQPMPLPGAMRPSSARRRTIWSGPTGPRRSFLPTRIP